MRFRKTMERPCRDSLYEYHDDPEADPDFVDHLVDCELCRQELLLLQRIEEALADF